MDTDVIYLGYTIFFTQTQGAGGGRDTQRGCVKPFAEIREMVCPRLGAGNALSGGGKLSEKQRLYVGGVTDSCLACSTPDTGESSVWTCCLTMDKHHTQAAWISIFTSWFGPGIQYFSVIHSENVCAF